jgi:2',3'-cyclic-nucleotide 2'-phosphodiesterase (5'-nucleotidase family)
MACATRSWCLRELRLGKLSGRNLFTVRSLNLLKWLHRPGEPSEVEALIGAAILEALRERGTVADGAMHGVFDEKDNFVAGPKTVNGIWNLIPFENYVVTAELTPEEIKTVMEEVYASREPRNLLGFEIETEGSGYEHRIAAIRLADGRTLERDKR